MSNPFERKFTQFADTLKQKNASATASEATSKAADIYEDKPFTQEFRGLFITAKVGAFLAQIVTFATTAGLGVFALTHIVPLWWGIYIAIPLGLLFAFGVERIKRTTTEKAAKFYLKYNQLGAVGAVAVTVALVSVGAAMYGAKELPNLVYPKVTVTTDTKQIDALKSDLAAVQADIDRTAKKLEGAENWQAENRTLPRLQKERARLSAALNAATEQATEQAGLDKMQIEYERAAKVEKMQTYSIAAAIIAEIIFLLASIFVLYYYFRQYAETAAASANRELAATRGDKIAVQNLQLDKVYYSTIPDNDTTSDTSGAAGATVGACLHCGAAFTKNTTRHKFCSEKCRVERWEIDNGKKLKRTKSGS